MNHKKNKKSKISKKKHAKRTTAKRGGQDPFESDIPAIGMDESFNLEDNPLDTSFMLQENSGEPGQLNESMESQGTLNLDDLNVSNQSEVIEGNNEPFGNWENPDYSGNTTFESFISEPSMEIGGKNRTKRSYSKYNKKHKKTRRSKKSKKMKKSKVRKSRKMYRKRKGGSNTDVEDVSPPAYNESYDEVSQLNV